MNYDMKLIVKAMDDAITKLNKIMKNKVTGKALDKQGEHWKAECPNCGKELEYKGWFDSSDLCRCDCGCEFYIEKLWLNDKEYIQ